MEARNRELIVTECRSECSWVAPLPSLTVAPRVLTVAPQVKKAIVFDEDRNQSDATRGLRPYVGATMWY